MQRLPGGWVRLHHPAGGGQTGDGAIQFQKDLGEMAHGQGVEGAQRGKRQAGRKTHALGAQHPGGDGDDAVARLYGAAAGLHPHARAPAVDLTHLFTECDWHALRQAGHHGAKTFTHQPVGPRQAVLLQAVDGELAAVRPGVQRAQGFAGPALGPLAGVGQGGQGCVCALVGIDALLQRLHSGQCLGLLLCRQALALRIQLPGRIVVRQQRQAQRARHGRKGVAVSLVQPGAATVDRNRKGRAVGPGPAAHPLGRLQHQH